MKPDELACVAADYLRMIRLGKRLAHLPLPLAYRLAAMAAKYLGPLRKDFGRFADYARAVGLPESGIRAEWGRAMAGHGMYFVNNFLHADRPQVIAARVREVAPDWASLVAERHGALVLTCHHDFHHSLFVLAGLAGKTVNFVVDPEDSGTLSPWLAPYICRQHIDCAKHFNGGKHIYTGTHQARQSVATALRQGELVFSMHDFTHSTARSLPATLLGRTYRVPAGTIEIALALGLPIYFAMLVWEDTHFAYRIECLRLHVTSDHPLDAYTAALESTVTARPSAWHGWQWV